MTENIFAQVDKGTDPFEALAKYQSSKDVIGGMTDTAGRWMTLGMADPMYAAGSATFNKALGEPGSWLELYHSALDRIRAREDAFAEAHPYLNAAAATAGALATTAPRLAAATGLPQAASSLGRQMLKTAGIGSGVGAISGAANTRAKNLPEAAQDTAISAAGGGVIGGLIPPLAAVASPVASTIANRFLPGSVDRQAARMVGERLAADFGSGPEGVARAQNELISGGAPLTLMDTGGENTLALAGRLARSPASRQQITGFLKDRAGGTGERLIGYVNRDFSPENAYNLAQEISAAQRARAAPLYSKAYSRDPLNPDALAEDGALTELMKRPSMKAAAARALKIAQEEGVNPSSLGLTFNEAGDVTFEAVPSWRTLAYMKRGLDSELNSHRNAVGQLDTRDPVVNATSKTRGQFKEFLHTENPELRMADEAFAAPERAKELMEYGAKFRSMRPEALEKFIAGLKPAEQEVFRIGAADKLRQDLMRTGSPTSLIGSAAANERGAEHFSSQLRAVFPKADDVTSKAASENKAARTMTHVVGGSPTATRLAEDVGQGSPLDSLTSGPGGDLAMAAGLSTTHPWLGAGLALRTLSKKTPWYETRDPRVYSSAANLLTDTNIPRAMDLLSSTPTSPRDLLLVPATETSGMYPEHKLPGESYLGRAYNALSPIVR